MGIWVSWYTCGGQRGTWQSQSSPSIMWFQGIDLRLEGLAACTFISQAALPGLDLGFK